MLHSHFYWDLSCLPFALLVPISFFTFLADDENGDGADGASDALLVSIVYFLFFADGAGADGADGAGDADDASAAERRCDRWGATRCAQDHCRVVRCNNLDVNFDERGLACLAIVEEAKCLQGLTHGVLVQDLCAIILRKSW